VGCALQGAFAVPAMQGSSPGAPSFVANHRRRYHVFTFDMSLRPHAACAADRPNPS